MKYRYTINYQAFPFLSTTKSIWSSLCHTLTLSAIIWYFSGDFKVALFLLSLFVYINVSAVCLQIHEQSTPEATYRYHSETKWVQYLSILGLLIGFVVMMLRNPNGDLAAYRIAAFNTLFSMLNIATALDAHYSNNESLRNLR